VRSRMGRMTARETEPFRVVFVCTGNICRSPMAEIVFRWFAHSVGLGAHVVSTSAGTGDWHVGERADERTLAALRRRGYEGGSHRARQFTAGDFVRNDLVVALDRTHERILRGWAPTETDVDKIVLLRSFDEQHSPLDHPRSSLDQDHGSTLDVPDPYYAGPEMFDDVLGMIESACRGLFRQLEPAIRPAS